MALCCIINPGDTFRDKLLDGRDPLIKKGLSIFTVCALLLSAAPDLWGNGLNWYSNPSQRSQIIQEFERSVRINGIRFRIVLLNNDTVESLFQGAGKYSIRARANMTTVFYVGARPERDTIFNVDFVVVQDGKKYTGEAINIQNFKSGPVTRGTKIDGLFQLDEKIDVTRPFSIKSSSGFSLEFKLSQEALRLMGK